MKLRNDTKEDKMVVKGYQGTSKDIPLWASVRVGAEIELADDLAELAMRCGLTGGAAQVGLFMAGAKPAAEKAKPESPKDVGAGPAQTVAKEAMKDKSLDIKAVLGRRNKK